MSYILFSAANIQKLAEKPVSIPQLFVRIPQIFVKRYVLELFVDV